jgi:hypothetical protein
MSDINQFHITFFRPICPLCLCSVDTEETTPFIAASASHPNVGRAEWREVRGSRHLCLGSTAASKIAQFGASPGLYILHSPCHSILATADRERSFYECFRNLEPILHEESSTWQRKSPSSPNALLASIIRDILSDFSDADLSQTNRIGGLTEQLELVKIVKKALPREIVEAILDYLPFELALTLAHFGVDRPESIRILRQDPVARRFECAFDILKCKATTFQGANDPINLQSNMTVQFVKLGGRWYLQDLIVGAKKEMDSQEKMSGLGEVKRIEYQPVTNQQISAPYVAVQVEDIGITHIALESVRNRPVWISPNKINKKAAFFQDRGSGNSDRNLKVTWDVRRVHLSAKV